LTAPNHPVSHVSLQPPSSGAGGIDTGQTWTTSYDDAISLKPKYEAAKAAGWRGVGFWQADGMWPNPYDSNITIYCKEEMDEMWQSVRDVWAPAQLSKL
jgi:hypothetical protein